MAVATRVLRHWQIPVWPPARPHRRHQRPHLSVPRTTRPRTCTCTTTSYAWAYYRVPTVSYEFTTPLEREALATSITVALAAIRMADAEVHLRIAHRPYAAADWATSLDATSDRGPGWLDYLEGDVPARLGQGFLDQRGVSRCPPRRARRARAAVRRSPGSADQLLPVGRAGTGADRRQGARLPRSPAGPSRPNASAARSCPPARWPRAMPAPTRSPGFSAMRWRGLASSRRLAARRRTWGAGEIESLLEGQIDNGRTILRVCPTPAASRGRRSCRSRDSPMSCTSRTASPGLHYADALPFPVEASLRMKLIAPALREQVCQPAPGPCAGHGRGNPGRRPSTCPSRWPSRSRRPGCWSTASPR